MKALVNKSEFQRALSNGIVSAGKEKGRDTLHHLEVTVTPEDKELRVVATDSYILTREILGDVDVEAGEPTTFLLHREDATRIVQACKSEKRAPVVVLEVLETAGSVIVSDTVVGFKCRDGYAFPNWRQILSDVAPEPEGTSLFALMSARLSDLSKYQGDRGKESTVRFEFGGSELKPARFYVGTTLEGLVMPVRIA